MDISTNYAHVVRHKIISRTESVVMLLKWTYGLVPIVAGADKFFGFLTDWDKYLAPQVSRLLPFPAGSFMLVVGIIEIAAGILVLLRPKLGSLVVSLWLVGIGLNLILTGEYYDVAVRDLVMAIGAFSLYLLLGTEKPKEKDNRK